MNPPPIPDHVTTNFRTLEKAAAHGDMALLSCIRRADSKPVCLLVAVGFDSSTREYLMSPFAEMIDGNPYDLYDPPPTKESPCPTSSP